MKKFNTNNLSNILEITVLTTIVLFVATIPLELFFIGIDDLDSNMFDMEQVMLLIVFSKVLDLRGFYVGDNKRKLNIISKLIKYSFTPASLLVIYSASYGHEFLAVIFVTITCAIYCYDLVVFEYDTVFDITDAASFLFALLSFGYFVII